MAVEDELLNFRPQKVPNHRGPPGLIDDLRGKWEDALMQLLALQYFFLASGRKDDSNRLKEFISAHHNWWWESGQLGYDQAAYRNNIIEAVLGVRQFDLKRTGGIVNSVNKELDALTADELVIYDKIYSRLYPGGLPRKNGTPVPSFRGVDLVDLIHAPPKRVPKDKPKHVVPPPPEGAEVASVSLRGASKGKSSPSETSSRSTVDAPSRTVDRPQSAGATGPSGPAEGPAKASGPTGALGAGATGPGAGPSGPPEGPSGPIGTVTFGRNARDGFGAPNASAGSGSGGPPETAGTPQTVGAQSDRGTTTTTTTTTETTVTETTSSTGEVTTTTTTTTTETTTETQDDDQVTEETDDPDYEYQAPGGYDNPQNEGQGERPYKVIYIPTPAERFQISVAANTPYSGPKGPGTDTGWTPFAGASSASQRNERIPEAGAGRMILEAPMFRGTSVGVSGGPTDNAGQIPFTRPVRPRPQTEQRSARRGGGTIFRPNPEDGSPGTPES